MKILQVVPALGQGGVERGTLEIARALTAAGIPNGVASSGGPLVAELERLGVPHHPLPLGGKNPFTLRHTAGALARLAQREDYTLFHVRSRAPAWSVKWASASCGIPWLATFHGVYGLSPRFLKHPYNRVMTQGVRTIAVSDYVRRHILANYAADPAKVVCIPRGADTAVFRPDAADPAATAALRQDYGFPDGIPIVTLPGRLTRWKGQEVFLSALRLMKPRELGILILGSDQGRTAYSDRLREMASKLPKGMRVVFRDHESDMVGVYGFSTIVVNASSDQPEAFGRTIPEAQAMGRLVLATAHGGACETVADGQTGFLVPPGSAPAMAERLEAMLELPPDARARISAAAVASVRANYSVAKMCASTLALYREIQP